MNVLPHLAAMPLVVVALGAPLQENVPPPEPPTPIEQALVEHRCRESQAPGTAISAAAHDECLRLQLQVLRDLFGRDLARLSGAERRALDAACDGVRNEQGRDAYVTCLSDQLAALDNRKRRAGSASPADATTSLPVAPAPPAPDATAGSGASATSSTLWIGVGLLALLAGGGGALLLSRRTKPQPAAHPCRICGRTVTSSGDLCDDCRHQAAEAVRRAASARVPEKAAENDPAIPIALSTFDIPSTDNTPRTPSTQSTENTPRTPSTEGTPSTHTFDPHVILGVSRGASQEEITAAYAQAAAKYRADQVAHLGADLQEYYRTKADEVERAYQALMK